MSATWLAALLLWAGLPVVEVDRAPFEIRESSRVIITAETLADPDGRGALRIIGDGLTIELDDDAVLRGADAETDPDGMTGIGIVITGRDVTLRGGTISGYKVGVLARGADGLTVEGLTLRDNFRQRLASKPWHPDERDRLDPHENDHGEWVERYGGGIVVEEARGVTIRDVKVRETQNGILFDRVHDSHVYDNDASFLSGWGIALWRSTGNTISQNAFDFCVRGSSHQTDHPRPQGSAAILLTEQSSENVLAINSLTHAGTGILCYAGHEAVGRRNPREEREWYEQRGSNENIFLLNDLSDAISFGVDLSFCRGTKILRNQVNRNALGGIRAEHVRGSAILRNKLEANGDLGDGRGQSGLSIRNGSENHVHQNWFRRNPVGLSMWSDSEEPENDLPWFAANPPEATGNTIGFNRFDEDGYGMRLEGLDETAMRGNEFFEFEDNTMTVLDDHTHETVRRLTDRSVPGFEWPSPRLPGTAAPRDRRRHLRGREHIVMLEWGPYDWSRPVAQRSQPPRGRIEYELYGLRTESVTLEIDGARLVDRGHERTSTGRLIHRIVIEPIPEADGAYRLRAEDEKGRSLEHHGRFGPDQ